VSLETTEPAPAAPVEGFVAPGFQPVADELAGLLAADAGYAAQFCAYAGGELVVDLWGGPDVDGDTLQGVFSSTKGVSGICMALLVERGLLDLDAPVQRYWPEFAQGGKDGVTVRVALSHQAGLVGVEPQVTLEDMLDHDAMAARLAAQVPQWRPGAAHGYHALTIGVIMDQLVRRIDGRTLPRFFREEIGDPWGVDFFIATPEDAEPRVRDVLPLQPTPEQAAELAHSPMRQGGDSLSGLAFNAAVSDPFSPLPANVRAVRAAGLPSVGGVGSGRGLARLYAAAISAVDGRPPLLSEPTIAAVAQIQTVGHDLVLGGPSRFAVVFQKPDERLPFGSHQAFGHDGAGGSLGIADPWHGLAYGYVPRRMSFPGGGDARGMSLAATTRRCLADRRP
jgi:CubicO group peptidase (beta-lactamase class C family)